MTDLRSIRRQQRFQRHLARLCAAAFAGRRIGTDGHDRAADWIATTMRRLGLAVEPFAFILEIPVLHLAATPAVVSSVSNTMADRYIEDHQCYTNKSLEEEATMQFLNRDGRLSRSGQTTDTIKRDGADSNWLIHTISCAGELIACAHAFTLDMLHHASAAARGHSGASTRVVTSTHFVVCCS